VKPLSSTAPVLWCARNVSFGAALGAALGSFGQAIVLVFGSAPMGGVSPSFIARIAGVLITAAGYAAILFASSVVTAPTMRWAAGRAISVLLTTLVVTALVAQHVVGVVVRLLSGSYMTRGAIEFVLNGQESLGRALRTTYIFPLLGVIAAGLLVAFLGGLFLSRALRHEGNQPRALRQMKATAILLSLGAAALSILPVRVAMARSLARTTPELAFLTSLGATPAWSEELLPGEEGNADLRKVVLGAPREAEIGWEAELQKGDPNRPNVILLLIDSLSTKHMGYLGYSRKVTPNIDRIAAGSMRLRRAWATATHSNYAQPAILSSLFPRRITWLDQYDRLDYPRMLIHDVFFRAGAKTATISSQDQNWQGILRFEQTDTPNYLWHAPDYQGKRVDIVSEHVVPDGVTAEKAIAWMEEHRAAPFSLYVNFQIAHFPYALPDGAREPYLPANLPSNANFLGWEEADSAVMNNRYDNAIAYVDAQVGKIAAYLEKTNQLENTLWVITADHGEMMGEHGLVTHGKSLHEGEARVPLLVHYPKRVAPADVDVPVSHLDVLPTMLELAGIAAHPSFQGRSFVDPAAYAKAKTGVFMNIQGFRMAEGVVCYPWKLWIDRSSGQEVRLYHLGDDPTEMKNLAQDKPNVSRALSRMIGAQMRAQVEYHDTTGASRLMRERHFAPRLLACPELPEN